MFQKTLCSPCGTIPSRTKNVMLNACTSKSMFILELLQTSCVSSSGRIHVDSGAKIKQQIN